MAVFFFRLTIAAWALHEYNYAFTKQDNPQLPRF